MEIAICGNHGSGKTVLAGRLSHEMGVPISHPHYGFFDKVAITASMNGNQTLRALTGLANRLVSDGVFNLRLGCDSIVDDPTVVRLLAYSQQYGPAASHVVFSAIKALKIGLPDAMIYLECPVELSKERISERMQKRNTNPGQSQLEYYEPGLLESVVIGHEWAVRCLKAIKPEMKVYKIDASQSMDKVLSSTVQCLKDEKAYSPSAGGKNGNGK